MRIAGYTLLLLGFVSAVLLTFLLEARVNSTASSVLDATMRKATFSRDEVQTLIFDQATRSRPPKFFILAPASMMLAGGILLGVGQAQRQNAPSA